MNFTEVSDYGLNVVTGNNSDQIGYTTPTTIYERMRQIQSFAQALDLNIHQFVADPVFRASWNAWYDNTWKPFYEKYAGPNASQQTKLGVVFYSDELAAQTNSYQEQLNHFEDDYHKQRQANGQPVPNVPGTAPEIKPIQSAAPGLPWYVWVIGGVAITVLGYFAIQKLRSNLRFLNRTPQRDFQRDQHVSFDSPPRQSAELMTLQDYANRTSEGDF